jgi:hypothetical protein
MALFRHALLIIGLSGASNLAAQRDRVVVRQTLWDYVRGTTSARAAHLRTLNTTTDVEESSPITVGTALGVTFYSDDPSTYKLANGIVVFDDERSKSQPSTYALPSVALFRVGPVPVSALVPFNIGKDDVAGVGLAVGVNAFKTSEVGIASFVVWQPVFRLTSAQQQSFANERALPTGASTELRQSKRPQLAVGVYITPELIVKK